MASDSIEGGLPVGGADVVERFHAISSPELPPFNHGVRNGGDPLLLQGVEGRLDSGVLSGDLPGCRLCDARPGGQVGDAVPGGRRALGLDGAGVG